MQGGQKIVRNTARKFRDDISRCRRDKQQIRALRNCNMFNRTFQVGFAAGFGEQVGHHFLSGQCRKRERRYEFARRARHHALHGEAVLLQAAHQFRGLVSRYPAGNAKRNAHGRFAACYLRRLLPSLSVSVFVPGLNSYSTRP